MTKRRSILLPAPPRERPRLETSVSFDVDEQLPLAPPTMWTRGFLILCGVVLLLGLLVVREMATTLDISMPWYAWAAPVAAVAVIVGIRRLLLPPGPRVIRFGADSVTLPGGRNSRRTFELAYDKIRTIVPLVSRGQPALVVDGNDKTHLFVARDFVQPQAWRILWARLMRGIRQLPDGQRQIARMRQLADLSQQASSVNARFTKRLFWVIAVIFGAQLLLSPGIDVLEFLYFGANSRVMVLQEGQLWRVVTANLLHGGGVHFAVNAFALYFLGTYCERLFGEGRTVVLTLGTALMGATASLMGTAAMFSVGISTALFGLLGAYFALHLRFGRQLPPPYRQSRLWWGVILGLNVVLSVAVPIIDAWGHFGGFAGGVVLGWLMMTGQKQFDPRRPSGPWTNLAAAGLVAIFAACSVIAIGYALGDHPDDELTVAQAFVDRADEEEPALLAQLAHEWAGHTPRPEGLDPLLVSLAEKAHQQGTDLFVEWRAAAAIIRLADEMGDPFDQEVMQIGIDRFEQSAVRHDSDDARRVLGDMLAQYIDDVGVLRRVESPFDRAEKTDGALLLLPAAPVDEPRRVYVIAAIDDRPDRLLYRCIPPGDATGADPKPVDDFDSVVFEVELAMVTAAERCTDAESERWRTTVLTAPDPPD